jgi:hypothetical protein
MLSMQVINRMIPSMKIFLTFLFAFGDDKGYRIGFGPSSGQDSILY